MGRRDRRPSPGPPPRPDPAPYFEEYEDGNGGKTRWTPHADSQPGYQDYRPPRTHKPKDPHHRPRRSPSMSSSDSDTPPPPRRRDRRPREPEPYDSYDEYYPPRRPRDGRHRPHDYGQRRRDDRSKDRGYAAGYGSDNRHNRPPRHLRDDTRDRRDRPRDDWDRRDRRRDDRYDGMFNDHDRGRDRRGRYDDDRYGPSSRSRGKSVGGQPRWQKEAIDMFKQYALPIIKTEGSKYISKQMAGIMSKR